MDNKSLLREILSLPALIIGASFLKIGEFISGSKHTYRGHEVMDILKKKMVCSKCGHLGNEQL